MCVSTVTQAMADKDWVTVKLPKPLADQIDNHLKTQHLRYTSRSELVKEAVNTYLTNAKKKPR